MWRWVGCASVRPIAALLIVKPTIHRVPPPSPPAHHVVLSLFGIRPIPFDFHTLCDHLWFWYCVLFCALCVLCIRRIYWLYKKFTEFFFFAFKSYSYGEPIKLKVFYFYNVWRFCCFFFRLFCIAHLLFGCSAVFSIYFSLIILFLVFIFDCFLSLTFCASGSVQGSIKRV